MPGFKVTQEDVEHLDPLRRLVAEHLIKTGEWVLVPRLCHDNDTSAA
jgi:hypothetical protein